MACPCTSAVHIRPVGDVVPHDLDTLDCLCGPRIEWHDPDTGDTYPDGPLVLHHTLDGREEREPEEVHPEGWSVDRA